MTGDRKREIERKAEQFRVNCEVSRYGILNLYEDCIRQGYKLIRYPEGENGVLGFALEKDSDVIIYTNSNSRRSREVFTLAHEIGHVNLHFSSGHSFLDKEAELFGSDDKREVEANYYAACLLMPASVIDQYFAYEIELPPLGSLTSLDVARIMIEFNVSFDMALNRLEALGKIDEHDRILLSTSKNEQHVGNLLRRAGGTAELNQPSHVISIPYEYLTFAIQNFNRHAIPLETLQKVLDYYGLTLDDIRGRVRLDQDGEDVDDIDDLLEELTD